MISVEQARDRILATLQPLPSESILLTQALDRCLGADVHAARALPAFDNSALDGYAVRSAEVVTASPASPVLLRMAAVTPAGAPPAPAFAPGECTRIFTGAPLPHGADAVVMQEDTRRTGTHAVEILDAVAPWEGVRLRGEDVQLGSLLARAGTRLGPAQLSLLASTGLAGVTAYRRPRLALYSTGNELVEPGVEPGPGQIHDSNSILLASLARRAHSDVVLAGRIADEADATATALQRAAAIADVIITTGGVSVGDADLLRPALLAVGGTLDLWRIAMKPGKPFAFGRIASTLWFGLPGNPVAAFVTWQMLVRPALERLCGHCPSPVNRRRNGQLAESIANRGDRRHFIRVTLGPDGEVRQAGVQGSHILSSLAAADGLIDVPPGTVWQTGMTVEVELTDG